jgi:hypothetical protein
MCFFAIFSFQQRSQMAPHNSTLIHESQSSNIETTSDEISHYSPILPAKNGRNGARRRSMYSQESIVETDVVGLLFLR